MNPIYLAYLKAHGLTEEPALYKFVIWAHQQAEAYRKAFKLSKIVDYEHYSNWVYDTAAKSETTDREALGLCAA